MSRWASNAHSAPLFPARTHAPRDRLRVALGGLLIAMHIFCDEAEMRAQVAPPQAAGGGVAAAAVVTAAARDRQALLLNAGVARLAERGVRTTDLIDVELTLAASSLQEGEAKAENGAQVAAYVARDKLRLRALLTLARLCNADAKSLSEELLRRWVAPDAAVPLALGKRCFVKAVKEYLHRPWPAGFIGRGRGCGRAAAGAARVPAAAARAGADAAAVARPRARWTAFLRRSPMSS